MHGVTRTSPMRKAPTRFLCHLIRTFSVKFIVGSNWIWGLRPFIRSFSGAMLKPVSSGQPATPSRCFACHDNRNLFAQKQNEGDAQNRSGKGIKK